MRPDQPRGRLVARLRAFAVHLGLSALVAVLMLWLVFVCWYPAPLHTAVGVTEVFVLLLAVDVVIGPLLTLLVYDTRKKRLIVDVLAIVVLQLAAFAYGTWTVAQGRPAWLVFNVDRFDLVRALDVDQRYLQEAAPLYRQAPWDGPRWVAADNPSDPKRREQLMLEAGMGGSDLPQRPELYRPLAEMTAAISARALPLSKLDSLNAPAAVQAQLAPWPAADAWLPLMAGAQPMVVLLQKGQVLAVVDLRPW